MPATRNTSKGRRARPYTTVREASVRAFESTAEVLAREQAEAKQREAAKKTALSVAEKRDLGMGWRILDLKKEHVEWSAPIVSSPFLQFEPAPQGKPNALDAWCAVVGPDFYSKLVQYHKENHTPICSPRGQQFKITPEHALLYHGFRFELMAATSEPRNTDTLAATGQLLR